MGIPGCEPAGGTIIMTGAVGVIRAGVLGGGTLARCCCAAAGFIIITGIILGPGPRADEGLSPSKLA